MIPWIGVVIVVVVVAKVARQGYCKLAKGGTSDILIVSGEIRATSKNGKWSLLCTWQNTVARKFW